MSLAARLYRNSMRAVREISPHKRHSRLYWWRPKGFLNFGDEIGPYLFTKITGRAPQFTRPSDYSPKTVYATVGSIIEHMKSNCIVWGSGVIRQTASFRRPYRVCSVRGPLTRLRFQELGYPCPAVFGDPAILLPRFFSPDVPKVFQLGIAPHYSDYDLASALFGGLPGVHVIDMRDDVENVVLEILQCETIASSSLHGCIVAHTYGIPASWIRLSLRLAGDGVKFLDYYHTIGIRRIDPIDLPAGAISESALSNLRSGAVLPAEWPDTEELLLACPFIA
jgi:pyruvyltransferase